MRKALLAALFAFVAGSAQAAPAIDYMGDFGGSNINPATVGYQFDVLESFNITALGVFDAEWDGLADAHPVAIWDVASEELIVSTTVPEGVAAPLIGAYRYVNVAITTLLAGHTYAIAAFYPEYFGDPDNDFFPQVCDFCSADPFTVDPRMVLAVGDGQGRYEASDGLVFPAMDFIPQLSANFLIEEPVPAPEPGALGLALLGLAGLARLRRRG